MKKIQYIEGAVPYTKYDKEGNENYIYLTNEVAYYFRNVLNKGQIGLVMHACFCYMDNKLLPEFDQASYMVFCKMLMDNGLIEIKNFKVQLKDEQGD